MYEKTNEIKEQLLVYIGLMGFATLSFLTVQWFSSPMAIWVILLLGSIQVLFQLSYFMHLKSEKNKVIVFFIAIAFLIAGISVAGIALLSWW